MKNLKKIFKILLYIFDFAIILVILSFGAFLFFLQSGKPRPIQDINQYKDCLLSIKGKDELKHFPKTIPDEAKDIDLYCYSAPDIEYEFVLLKFKIDKSYIEKEFKSHSFINPNTPVGTKQKLYHMPSDTVKISSDKLTYYVLKDKGYSENEDFFPYYSGIGISEDMNYILYYYFNPD